MATSLQTIKRLTIEARTSGVNEASASLTALSRAQTSVAQTAEGMAVSTDAAAKKQISAARSYDAVRAKVDEAYRSQIQFQKMQNIVERAFKQGAIGADEYSKTSDLVARRFGMSTDAANANAKAVGLARYEMINLGRQAQDVGTMLAMGASPMQVFTSQAAQVVDIFSSSQGTLRGFFGQVTSGLSSIITPARLAFGGIATGAIAAAAAVNSYLETQRQVSMALTGIGRASGATVGGINAIANQGSSTFGLSIGEAREMASAMAATGRIANDNILPIVKMGKDIAYAFGVDATEATKLLAQSFADPARGADTLNARLGFMDAAMKRNIDNLVAQNRLWDAQRVLIQGVQGGLVGVADATSRVERGWTAVGNALSNVWDRLGGIVARALNLEKLDLSQQLERSNDRIADLQRRLEGMNAARSGGYGSTFSGQFAAVEKALTEEIALRGALTQKIADQTSATARAQAAQQSFAQEAAIRQLVPEIAQREALNNQLQIMEGLLKSLGSDEGAGERLRALGVSFEIIAKAIDKAKAAVQDFKTESQRAAINERIALDAVTAYSPTARADIARRQTREQYSGSPEAETRAQVAYTLALRQATESIREQARERALAAEQNKNFAQLEIDLVGKTIAEQTTARANLQTRQQMEMEAARQRTTVDEAEYARLVKINQELGRKVQMRAEADLRGRVQFETDTLFMSPTNQRIAGEMRSIYGNDWQSQMNGALASQMRMNDLLRDYGSIASSSFVTFGQNLRNGVSWMGSLKNAGLDALGKISDKLLQMAADDLLGAALGRGRSGGGGGGILGLLGGLFSGGGSSGAGVATTFGGTGFSMTGTGGLYAEGGVFSRGRVVPFANGDVLDRPVLFPMAQGATGLMGEAGPEAIMPLKRGRDGKLGVASSGGDGGGVVVHLGGVTIDARGAQAGVGEEIEKAMASFVRGPAFQAAVSTANTKNRAARKA